MKPVVVHLVDEEPVPTAVPGSVKLPYGADDTVGKADDSPPGPFSPPGPPGTPDGGPSIAVTVTVTSGPGTVTVTCGGQVLAAVMNCVDVLVIFWVSVTQSSPSPHAFSGEVSGELFSPEGDAVTV